MNNYYNLKKNVIEPALKKNGFKKFGNVWMRKLHDGTTHIVDIYNRTVVVNDFYVGISMPFVVKHGVGNCIVLASKWKTGINDSWNSNNYTDPVDMERDVAETLENGIIPFLNNFKSKVELSDVLTDKEIEEMSKSDSIRALAAACFFFLTSDKNKGKAIVSKLIANSKLKFEFAENILNRMNNIDALK